MDNTGTIWLPRQGSTIAPEVDGLFYFLLYLSVICMILIFSVTLYLVIKYRRKGKRDQFTSGPNNNHTLEVIWTIVPSIIVIIIFVWGFRTYLKMNIVPANAMQIKVTAQKWFWSFDYPDGATTVNELVVPVGKPIKMLMSSQDVLHSFFVPSFRVKMDVLPNRYTVVWFEAVRTGEFDLFCTEYCGKGHSEMLARVKVFAHNEYEEWSSEQGFDPNAPPEVRGEKLYSKMGCKSCHSIDGSRIIGPTFKGLYGTMETLESGESVLVDENYIRESLINPMAKVTAGYEPVMTPFGTLLDEREIDDLIAYLKSLK